MRDAPSWSLHNNFGGQVYRGYSYISVAVYKQDFLGKKAKILYPLCNNISNFKIVIEALKLF